MKGKVIPTRAVIGQCPAKLEANHQTIPVNNAFLSWVEGAYDEAAAHAAASPTWLKHGQF